MVWLLVVLLAACVLPFTVYLGRGFWQRARSVERHKQALDTLADITKAADVPGLVGAPSSLSGAFGAPGPKRGEHQDRQAHVRVIGPAAQTTAEGALPPPRPSARPGHSNASPLHRPSRTAPSAAAIDAVATAAIGAPTDARVVRTGRPRPPARPARADETIPGMAPVPPPRGREPPTRPLPVIRPHVYYFDDLAPGGRGPGPATSAPATPPEAGPAPPAPASPVGEAGQHVGELALTGSDSPGDELAVDPPSPWGGDQPATPSALPMALRSRPRPAHWLAAAAILVVVGVAAALALTRSPSQPTAAQHRPPATSGHARPAPKPTTTPAPAPKRTTTTVPAKPPKPAILLSVQQGPSGGTATYQLTSASASIVVQASGPCWIEVRAGSPAGQVIYTGTLEQGQRSSVTGPAWIRLGDPPDVAVSVNGTQMPVPGASQAVPLNLQFTFR
ncbi:MAG: RodZ domain-containing protein [Acidimicrobiales bacterium]